MRKIKIYATNEEGILLDQVELDLPKDEGVKELVVFPAGYRSLEVCLIIGKGSN